MAQVKTCLIHYLINLFVIVAITTVKNDIPNIINTFIKIIYN